MAHLTSQETELEARRHKRGCLITFGLWLLSLGWIFGYSTRAEAAEGPLRWLTVLAWALVIFGVPSVGFLQGIELKHYLDWKNQRTAGSQFFRFLIGLGCWLLALVSGLAGAFMTVAALKNVWSTSLSWKETAGMLVFGLGFVAVAVILLRLPFRSLATTTEAEDRALAELLAQKLAHPDFDSIERQTGHKLPEGYRDLFKAGSVWLDRSWTLYPRGLEDDETVHEFTRLIPAELNALRKDPRRAGDFVCFAEGDETEFWFPSGDGDPPVFEYQGNDVPPAERLREICPRLSEFLGWPREES